MWKKCLRQLFYKRGSIKNIKGGKVCAFNQTGKILTPVTCDEYICIPNATTKNLYKEVHSETL